MIADTPVSTGPGGQLRTPAVPAEFEIVEDVSVSSAPRHPAEGNYEEQGFPQGHEELFSQLESAVHTDADEMPPVTAIWALLDSGLRPGEIQPRKWLLNLRSILVDLNASLTTNSRREDPVLARRDMQTRARCLQMLGYMIAILYQVGDKQWAWIALYYCLSGQASAEPLSSGCLGAVAGFAFSLSYLQKDVDSKRRAKRCQRMAKQVSRWAYASLPPVAAGLGRRATVEAFRSIEELDRGGDGRRIRGDKRQFETPRFLTASDFEDDSAEEKSFGTLLRKLKDMQMHDSFDVDSFTNQLAPSFVKEQRARTEPRGGADAAGSADGSSLRVGRDAVHARDDDSESAWTRDEPITVSTSTVTPGQWSVSVTVGSELSAHSSTTAPPWRSAGNGHGSYNSASAAYNAASASWSSQYPTSGLGGYYYGSPPGYESVPPWWSGAPSWSQQVGWRHGGW